MGEVFWIVVVIVNTVVGGVIGEARKAGCVYGAVMGLILGPIGWFLTWWFARRRCPECRGKIPDDATRCRHCAQPTPLPPEMRPVNCPRCATPGQVAATLMQDRVTCPTCAHIFTPCGTLSRPPQDASQHPEHDICPVCDATP
jgi:hypothetical protein